MQCDPIGTAVFVPAICCLFVALQYGALEYGWDDKKVILLFVVSAILLAAFAWVQWKRQDAATLPPRIIRQRSILAGFLFGLCVNSAINVVTYYVSDNLICVEEPMLTLLCISYRLTCKLSKVYLQPRQDYGWCLY